MVHRKKLRGFDSHQADASGFTFLFFKISEDVLPSMWVAPQSWGRGIKILDEKKT